ncbi:hypothetical protein [Streptomyces sp. NPDC056304]|uniref:hypothetical protein n=1 Tax=Streptomyces sp. NPDC056304 TaxID=3345778 RepID=UPI0035DF9123
MLYLPKNVHAWFVPRSDRALHRVLIDAEELDGTTLVAVPRGQDGAAALPYINSTDPVLLASSSSPLRHARGLHGPAPAPAEQLPDPLQRHDQPSCRAVPCP